MNPVFDSLDSIAHAVNYFLASRQLTLGAVFTAMVPFFVLWSKYNREKDKKKRSMHIERTQQRMERNQKKIMDHFEILGEWDDGEWAVDKPNWSDRLAKKLWTWLRTSTSHVPFTTLFTRQTEIDQSISRRKNMLTTILKANLSKKLISALVAMAIVSLNGYLHLNIQQDYVWGVLGLSLSHISLQTIIDSIKAWALSKATTIVQTLPTVDDVVQKAIADPVGTHQDAVEIANSFIKTFNSVISNLKKNDNSLDYAESKSFLAELKVIEARYKPLELLTTIPEQKVSA